METLILNPISPAILIGAGIALIALESVIVSFVVIWFGMASLIVGCVSCFVLFTDGFWQLSIISIIAILLLFILRTRAMSYLLKSKDKEYNDNTYNEKGIGVIKEGKVYYKATYWNIDPMFEDKLEENQKVEVLSIKGITATIEIISDANKKE